jgi:hypothetical protein
MADDRRFGDEGPALADGAMLGRWPDELETEAVTSLAATLGDHAWDDLASAPAVVQGIADRARLQPLDRELLRELPHLQHVCHRPRLHLRVDEERVPVSRARRTPVRAVADLVSHPGDWEHRTLRSIQPSRVLARLIEDEWNLYENRVAVRLVDHLLAYVARRLVELLKVERSLRAHKENVDEGKTSFWRARRIMTLWAGALDSKIEDDLRATRQQLEHARRELQALLDAPLYQQVPRRVSVALSLQPTNILVNDPHYRKVAALWRAWVKLGHRRQETQEQRAARRQLEARAWDRFVLHLVVRAFSSLSWSAIPARAGWTLSRDGHSTVDVTRDDHGVIVLRAAGGAALRLLPLCASFAKEDGPGLLAQLRSWDRLGALVAVYVHPPVERAGVGAGAGTVQLPLEPLDPDRASGWVVAERAALLGCSPWAIDSEERMTRLLNGWIHRTTVPRYPAHEKVRDLPTPPSTWRWLRYDGIHLVALQAPTRNERDTAATWAAAKEAACEAQARAAKTARQTIDAAPIAAIKKFSPWVDQAASVLGGLGTCPVCGEDGHVEARPGKEPDGSDATWWAHCTACESEWGLRLCRGCGTRYRALTPAVGFDLQQTAGSVAEAEWPDRVLGRDVWAQPCRQTPRQFRCPCCGRCAQGDCGRCQ